MDGQEGEGRQFGERGSQLESYEVAKLQKMAPNGLKMRARRAAFVCPARLDPVAVGAPALPSGAAQTNDVRAATFLASIT